MKCFMVYAANTCYTPKHMRALGSLPATVFSLLIAVGLLCAQVCDLSCSIRACSFMTPASHEAHHHQHADTCHHHDNSAQSESHRQPDHHAPDCQMHGDVTAALPHHGDALAAAHYAPQPMVAALPVPANLFAGSSAFSKTAQQFFRPPPRQSSITVLRI